jgi:hypothetical protein
MPWFALIVNALLDKPPQYLWLIFCQKDLPRSVKKPPQTRTYQHRSSEISVDLDCIAQLAPPFPKLAD